MEANHLIVWLDHRETHIFAFSRETAKQPLIVRSPHQHVHLHRRADVAGSGKANKHLENREQNVAEIREVLDHMIGIEAVDHPSDGQLLKYSQQYFVKTDRIAGVSTPM
jgi:hypothetical protein